MLAWRYFQASCKDGHVYISAQLPQLTGTESKVMLGAVDEHFLWGLGTFKSLELSKTSGLGSSPVFGVKTLLSPQLQESEMFVAWVHLLT